MHSSVFWLKIVTLSWVLSMGGSRIRAIKVPGRTKGLDRSDYPSAALLVLARECLARASVVRLLGICSEPVTIREELMLTLSHYLRAILRMCPAKALLTCGSACPDARLCSFFPTKAIKAEAYIIRRHDPALFQHVGLPICSSSTLDEDRAVHLSLPLVRFLDAFRFPDDGGALCRCAHSETYGIPCRTHCSLFGAVFASHRRTLFRSVFQWNADGT
jgi:hypothetical protein